MASNLGMLDLGALSRGAGERNCGGGAMLRCSKALASPVHPHSRVRDRFDNGEPVLAGACSGHFVGAEQHLLKFLAERKWNKAFDVEPELLVESVDHGVLEAELRKPARQLLHKTGGLRLARID